MIANSYKTIFFKIKYTVDDHTSPVYVFGTLGDVMPTVESNVKPAAAKYYSPGLSSRYLYMIFWKTSNRPLQVILINIEK